jgi:beta-glucosidase
MIGTRMLTSVTRVSVFAGCLAIGAANGFRAQQSPVYKDPSRSTDDRVADLLSRMTIQEKFWQLFMIPGDLDDPAHDYSYGAFGLQIRSEEAAREHAGRINAIQRYFVHGTRLGIPIVPFEEALHGVTMPGATSFPQAIALAATWDPVLVGRVAAAIALETRSRGIRQVLSPVVNIADDVRWGRVEETYGEDPVMASAMAEAFVTPFERIGIVTTPKHFVANVGEGGRDSYPVHHSERLLIERYFPPFEASLRAGARSLMTAYNSVDGSPATQNRWLLTDVLRKRWGFRGFVISDAAATGGATVLHMTEANTGTAARHAIASGLDAIFQSSWPQHRPYLAAFTRETIDRAAIDAAVARVLRVKFELGLFEQPFVDGDRAGSVNGHADHLALARLAALKAIVLLRNEGGALPLAKTLRRIAVIGPDAIEARLGGYSRPEGRKVTILEGITKKLGAGAAVRHVPGPGRDAPATFVPIPADALSTRHDGKPQRGLHGQYFDNVRLEGAPRFERIDDRMDFRWTLNSPGRGLDFDWYSVRWTGTVTAPPSGVRRMAIEGNDGYRLSLDNRLVIDNWRKQGFGRRTAEVKLEAGTTHEIRVEYFESTGSARLRLLWDAEVVDDSAARIEEAVHAARTSEAAIVVAGIEEGEFRDRASLSLPGRQEELIRAVAATGTPTIVVLVGGSAVTMSSWIEAVAGVVDAWYPGEQGGAAVADVLFGDENPGGRLPITFPVAEGQLPLSYNHKPTGRGDDYMDMTGMPLFPFGFGLSYTSFEYANLRIEPSPKNGAGTVTVRCEVKNTGLRAGDEVVQLYIRDVLASVARPVMQLRGFTRLHLAAGESREVAFTLGPHDLRMLDVDLRWVVEPGAFRVMVGASSEDVRLRGEFTVK